MHQLLNLLNIQLQHRKNKLRSWRKKEETVKYNKGEDDTFKFNVELLQAYVKLRSYVADRQIFAAKPRIYAGQ